MGQGTVDTCGRTEEDRGSCSYVVITTSVSLILFFTVIISLRSSRSNRSRGAFLLLAFVDVIHLICQISLS